jgi:hypothetical protein
MALVGSVDKNDFTYRIYDASDFVFNQRNLNVQLDEVLNEYYPTINNIKIYN